MSEGVLRSEGAASPRGGSEDTKAATPFADAVATVGLLHIVTAGGSIVPAEAVVRAVLYAVREPSEAMWEAGQAEIDSRFDGEYLNHRAACYAWQAMIDRALTEPQPLDEGKARDHIAAPQSEILP